MPDSVQYPPPEIGADGTWYCRYHGQGHASVVLQRQLGNNIWVCEEVWSQARACPRCGERELSMQSTLGGGIRCYQCVTNGSWRRCTDCLRWGRLTRTWYETGDGDHVCEGCYDDHWHLCNNDYCDRVVRSYEDYCWSHSEPEYDEDESSGLVNYYSYKPAPIFHGEGNLFMGFELEIGTPYGRLDQAAQLACDYLGGRGYLKDDSSISHGFEIVTHPMTHAYAIGSFPWQMLDDLRDLGCDVDEYENGMHVHVNREAFQNPLHVYRWMKFLHRNADQVQRIARRENCSWARWTEEARVATKDLCKGGHTYRDERFGREYQAYAERYWAINVQNTATFEVRAFASTLNRQEAQAALDLVAGSVEYTRLITAHDVANGAWDWVNFAEWVDSQPHYAALTGEMEALACAC